MARLRVLRFVRRAALRRLLGLVLRLALRDRALLLRFLRDAAFALAPAGRALRRDGALVLALVGLFELVSIPAPPVGSSVAELSRSAPAGLLLVGLLARPGSAPSWVAGLALGGTVIALIALTSRIFGFGGDTELARALPSAAERLSHPLGYWHALGYLMAMTVPPLAYLAAAGRSSLARVAVAASVPVILVLFLTSSRGALLAAVIGLAAVLWTTDERRRLLRAWSEAQPGEAHGGRRAA